MLAIRTAVGYDWLMEEMIDSYNTPTISTALTGALLPSVE